MQARELSELLRAPSDFGTFDLSIQRAERLSDSQPILAWHYRCAESSALQQLQQSWAFVQRYSHDHLGKVWAVERPGVGELVVYTEDLQLRVGEWFRDRACCPWSVEVTFDQISGLIEVLAEAQRNNVLHRHLSLHSIYWDENSQTVKLLDFSPCSLSTEDDRRFVKDLPQRYISPERTARQWICSMQSAAKADVYSLGASVLDLVYEPNATNQTAAVLLAGLSDIQPLYSLLEQMLREDPRQRPDFIRLQSYLRGDPEAPVEEVKVQLPPRPPAPPGSQGQALVPPAVGSSCPHCNAHYKLDIERRRGMCQKCFYPVKSAESKAAQPGLAGPPLPKKEENPLRVMDPLPKPQLLPQKLLADVQVQRPVLPLCEKCSQPYDSSPSKWRLDLCANRSVAELTEIYKYCSETCLPDRLKAPNLPASLPVAVPASSKFVQPAPKVAPPPVLIPVASEPMQTGPRPASPQKVLSSQRSSLQSGNFPQSVPDTPNLCALCFKPFAPLYCSVRDFENYANFCSEECQLKYLLALGEDPLVSTVSVMYARKALEDGCLQCSGGVAGGRPVVLPCSHQFCSRNCASQYLDRELAGLPGAARDLNVVIKCPKCEKPISPELIREWQEVAAPGHFPVPVGDPPIGCSGCGNYGPAKSTVCGHWLCENCATQTVTASTVRCPKCGTETTLL